MRNITKKIMIFSMIGIIQTGFGASIIEASAFQNDRPMNRDHQEARFDHRDHDRDEFRQREYDRKVREENDRYEQEIQRHRFETRQDWRERRSHEKHRHEQILKRLAREKDQQGPFHRR
ncbi:hypothetical protein SAMN05660742_115116 [Propionispira arboris]|uniref:Uncharacterized protein n=2 Tax=Propionispira arboris TaxID=84035 RepID=A0A1H7BI44_9FIRM|nr:hypothetical protein SAMN05660742_115116 [Propionispira arboris]